MVSSHKQNEQAQPRRSAPRGDEKMTRRYDLKIGNEDEETEMVERQDGDWVMADDYNEIVQENADLRKIIVDAIERLRDA
jgi:hypothetical protein